MIEPSEFTTGAARRRFMLTITAATAALVLLTSGCGTRASDAEVRAGVAAGPVTIDPDSVQSLVNPAADPAADAAVAVPGAGSSSVETGTADAAPGPAPGNLARPGAAPDRPKANGQPTTSGAPVTKEQPCTTPGAPVALGQVGVFSGVVGPIAGDALQMLAVWAKDINARGGLACHPVTIFVRDDGGDPARAAVAARELINEKKVVAFVGNILALSMKGFLPEMEKSCIPTLGADIGSFEWSTHPCLYPQGGGLDEAIAGLIRSAADNGSKRLGLLYCVEAALCTGLIEPVRNAAAREGLELVYDAPISVTQPDFTAQCQNAKNAGVQELALAMDGSSVARLARSCKALGYMPILVTGGFAFTAKQAEDPVIRSFDVTTVGVNAPWFLTSEPGLREYQQALRTYAPQLRPAGMSSQVWSSAKLLEAGVAALGPAARTKALTAADINAGLRTLENETLGGLTGPLDFTPANKGIRTSGCTYITKLGKDGFTAPRGSRPLCNLLPDTR
ncbi:MAG: ABC transporter substrate-binding protein [Sporichthyaceae bacterium]